MENNNGNKLSNMRCMMTILGILCAIGAIAMFVLSSKL